MAYLRSKEIKYKNGTSKGTRYFYLVEAKKDDNGKIKQDTVHYIGDMKKLLKLYKSIKRQIKKDS